jgi:hypothetical protein
MLNSNLPPTDPDQLAADAKRLGISVDRLKYRCVEARYVPKTNNGGGHWAEHEVSPFDPHICRANSRWEAVVKNDRQYEIIPSKPEQSNGHPIFGHRDRRFIKTFEKVAAEMDVEISRITKMVLARVDMNRIERKMSLPKAVKDALQSFKRMPEWFVDQEYEKPDLS